jgi:hypothetical protein
MTAVRQPPGLTEAEKRLLVLCLQAVLVRAQWSLGLTDHRQLDSRDFACEQFAKEQIEALIAKLEGAP